jgi:hypothetical protein
MLIRDVPKCMRHRVCDTDMHTGFSMASATQALYLIGTEYFHLVNILSVLWLILVTQVDTACDKDFTMYYSLSIISDTRCSKMYATQGM